MSDSAWASYLMDHPPPHDKHGRPFNKWCRKAVTVLRKAGASWYDIKRKLEYEGCQPGPTFEENHNGGGRRRGSTRKSRRGARKGRRGTRRH